MMHLLLTTLKNLEWLTSFSYPSTAEECDRQESREQAGESAAMKWLWRKSVGRGKSGLCTEMCHTLVGKSQDRQKFFDHRTPHHYSFMWVAGDLVNKSTKLYLCSESSKSPLVGMHLFQHKNTLASVSFLLYIGYLSRL